MSVKDAIQNKMNPKKSEEIIDVILLREQYKDVIVIGIIGSRSYQSERHIRKFVHKMKYNVKDNIIICSGGQSKGADGMVKRAALEFEMQYVEFPPAHYNWNQHCILPAHMYGKDYAVWNFNNRNTQIAEFSDKIVAFIPEGVKLCESKGTNDTCKKSIKLKKQVLIVH